MTVVQLRIAGAALFLTVLSGPVALYVLLRAG